MHCYRSLSTIKALTFDLDDTLYDNSPFLQRAVEEMIKVIQQVDGLQQVTLAQYDQVKQDLLITAPEIYHDVVIWRHEALKRFLTLHGLTDKTQINKIADDAMERFVYWRNQIIVPDESIALLSQLADKYPLAVITNGNADINKIGLAPYFAFALRAGPDGLSKPFLPMFQLAADKLKVKPEYILHVGDNLYTDVQGAINAHLQACWLNMTDQDIYQCSLARVLPHMEITQLSELNYLL